MLFSCSLKLVSTLQFFYMMSHELNLTLYCSSSWSSLFLRLVSLHQSAILTDPLPAKFGLIGISAVLLLVTRFTIQERLEEIDQF